MVRSLFFCFILCFCTNNVFSENRIITRIFKFLQSVDDPLSFEQNKALLRLILYNKHVLFKELTKNNNPPYQIAQIFLKLAILTSENFNKIAPRDCEFGFHKDQLKRFWKFIIKKIKLLEKSEQTISLDIRFIKIPPPSNTSENE